MSDTKKLRVAMLSTVAWRTPPKWYGPMELISSLLAEGLVKKGVDVTLFATQDSITEAALQGVCPKGYEEDKTLDQTSWSALHIANCMDRADEFDIIHNHFDIWPLTYAPFIKTPILTTIHGYSHPDRVRVYEAYNGIVPYVSISDSFRHPKLQYASTIYHGIDLTEFTFQPHAEDYLLVFARIHPEKGIAEAIEIAQKSNTKLIIAGIIADKEYYEKKVSPHIDQRQIIYVGNVGPEERNKLMGKAIALLHPIHFDEPFGLGPVEAMACGTPVIAFNRGSMPEVIADKKTGFLVSSVEEAVQCVQKIDDINRADCRSHVEEKFTVERMVDDYLRLYHQIVSR